VAETGEAVAELDERVPADRLADVGFATDRTWQLVLPDGEGYRFFVGRDGPSWTELARVAPSGASDQADPLLQAHRPAVALVEWEDGWLHVGTPDDGWHRRELPSGGRWAGVDAHGWWWVVGSKPSTRIPDADREIALWREEASGWTQVRVRPASWVQAYRTIRNGGFEQLRAIDAAADPFVLASQCAWFHDDPSWFLFTRRDGDRFHVRRLRHRRLAALNRRPDGTPLARTVDGECWDWTGRGWQPRGYRGELASVLEPILGRPYGVHVQTGGERALGVARSLARDSTTEPVAIRRREGGWSVVDLEARPLAAWFDPGAFEE
jgi:hypothetical protein